LNISLKEVSCHMDSASVSWSGEGWCCVCRGIGHLSLVHGDETGGQVHLERLVGGRELSDAIKLIENRDDVWQMGALRCWEKEASGRSCGHVR